ncbi:dihydroneopterin aldolase [Kiloniella sp. b19]|uniref:dihydroneopterin aldolase n=1 Tax=Kiloniella sp. GXU_MW_B19 TaxID=3141326 RepID=UPI0031CDB18B
MSILKDTTLTEQLIHIRDMTVSCHIGLTDEERERPQRLRLNVTLTLDPQATPNDAIDETINYGTLTKVVRQTVLENRVRLLETLFDQVVEACFFDDRIKKVAVKIEKLDRYPDVAGIGIEMVRERN